jgi:hypothetical protein
LVDGEAIVTQRVHERTDGKCELNAHGQNNQSHEQRGHVAGFAKSGRLRRCLQSSASNLFRESLVISLILVGVAFGKLGQGLIERIARTEVAGDGNA